MTPYAYTLEEVKRIRTRIYFSRMSVPSGFWDTTPEELQKIFNGVGPENWSSRFRSFVSWVLDFLDAPAMIHDWEYTKQAKTYRNFTLANLRLIKNAWYDNHTIAGLTAGILCQLFGCKAFKNERKETMNKMIHLSGILLLCSVVFTGCSTSSTSVISEYDASGNLTRRTETNESMIHDIMTSTKDKTILVWESGWMAYVSGTVATVENPTPGVKMFAGKSDKGLLSVHQSHTGIFGKIPEIIQSTRQDLTITQTGISTGSGQ